MLEARIGKFAGSRAGAVVEGSLFFYDATTANDTRQEEDQHRDQRCFAGGFQNKPVSFATQSVLVSNHLLAKEWHFLGGRDLTLPPPAVRRVYQDTCQHRTIYNRPNKGGSVAFFYMNEKLTSADRLLPVMEQRCRRKALVQEYRDLPDLVKQRCPEIIMFIAAASFL